MRRRTRTVKGVRNGGDRVAGGAGVPQKAPTGRVVVKSQSKDGALRIRIPRVGKEIQENGAGVQSIKPTMRASRQRPLTRKKVMASKSRVAGDLAEDARGDVVGEVAENGTGLNEPRISRKSPSPLMTRIRRRQTTAMAIPR
jgi:hypothetical protein